MCEDDKIALAEAERQVILWREAAKSRLAAALKFERERAAQQARAGRAEQERDRTAARAEALSAAFVEGRIGASRLEDLPLPRRDELIAEAIRFLVERGYKITAPGRRDA